MEREYFTFLISSNNDNAKLSINSKPWWCVTYSSSSSEKSENKEEEEDLENCLAVSRTSSCHGRDNFADMKVGVEVVNYKDNMENIDLLWEDFNEEMICRSCRLLAEPEMPSRRIARLGCIGAFKLAKAGGGRKPNAGVLIRLLKKLLVHNT